MPGYFLRSVFIGLAIAAPVGPIGVLCIRRTLAYGRLSGFISGLGAATADAFYGSIAAFGLTLISAFLVNQQFWLRLVGGIFLLYLGVRTLLERPAAGDLQNPLLPTGEGAAATAALGGNPGEKDACAAVAGEQTSTGAAPVAANVSHKGLLSDYFSTLFLTLTNPMTILSFAAIFAGLGLGAAAGDLASAALMVLGVFLGSAFWWLALSSGADLLRARFLTPRGLIWVNRISGLIIVAYGLVALGSLLI